MTKHHWYINTHHMVHHLFNKVIYEGLRSTVSSKFKSWHNSGILEKCVSYLTLLFGFSIKKMRTRIELNWPVTTVVHGIVFFPTDVSL